MKKERGITLIALVITIIVLIILAGISINLLLGENGIITKAKRGKGDYQEASLREKVEMALVDYNSDKIVRGEEGQIEEALNKLLDKGIFDDIEIEEKIGMTDDYEITLGKEKGEVIIEGVDKITGELRLRCRLSTREYTKKDVTIFVKSIGKVVKVIKPDNTEEQAVEGKVEINYLVSQNGTYVFKAEDINGNIIEKTVIVNNIDTLPPKEFTIEAKSITGTGFSINAEAEDSEATENSACSGIDRYEYFVKRVEEENYPERPYTTNEITGLSQGKYNVYAVAYDRAGNERQTDTIQVSISPKFVKISAGNAYFTAIDTEGYLWTWGGNNKGELGDGSTIARWNPKKILTEYRFKDVSGGYGYTLALDTLGDVWGWGTNGEYGVIGNNSTSTTNPVKVLSGKNIVSIRAGFYHALALDEIGDVWGWGDGEKNGAGTNSKIPIRLFSGYSFIAIDAGAISNFAMDKEGKLWAWGRQTNNSFGNGVTASVMVKDPIEVLNNITLNPNSDHHNFSITGRCGGLVIATNNTIWSWGNNTYGQVGNNSTSVSSPVNILKDIKFKYVASGSSHSLAIDEEGNLWAWGCNIYGQIGNNSRDDVYIPIKIKEGKFKAVSGFGSSSMALDENGDIWTWGVHGGHPDIPTKVDI